jgi:hypothetical protein
MDLDALFRMPMKRRPKDGGLRPFACGPGAGAQPSERFGGEACRVCLVSDLAAGR